MIFRIKENLNDRTNTICTAVFSMLFSICFLLTFKVSFSGNITDRLNKNYIRPLHIWDVPIFVLTAAIVFFAVQIIIILLDSAAIKRFFARGNELDKTKVFKACFFANFFTWMLFFLTFYPIVGMNDSLWIIKQPLQMAGQHPILYNLFLSGCYNIGKFIFGSETAGLAAYSIIQMLIMNLCASFCVAWLSTKKCPKPIIYIAGVYFAFMPIIADYSITAIKDTLFSTLIMLFIPILYELVQNNGALLKTKKGILAFAFFSLTICLIRNNGTYVLAGVGIILFFVIKNMRRTIALIVCIVIAASTVPDRIVKQLGVETLFQEAVAVPLQQIGMVVASDKITEPEDIKFVENLLPLREFRSNYSPMSVDTVKWDGNFNTDYLNSHPGEFLAFWFKQLLKHPLLYVEAYLLETYGFWSIGTQNGNQYVFFDITSTASNIRLKAYLAKEGIKNLPVFSDAIQQPLVSFYRTACKYIGAGSCFWIFMLIALLLIVRRKTKYLAVMSPCAFVWLTLMISAPVAFAFRYVFMYVMCMPFVLMLPFICGKDFKNGEDKNERNC